MLKSELEESTGENSTQTRPQRWQWRRLYSWLGFQKRYNVLLFIIFAGAMLGFSLARLEYLDLDGRFSKSASPGEWYWYRSGHYRVGLLIHLATVLPGGILMIFQFIPAVRHRSMLFHRINGHLIIVLILISHAGALMIVRRAFGGELATQAIVGVLVILTTIGIAMAYYNIKRLQVDQHRAWMLRTMFYMGTIITTRIIMVIAASITSRVGSYDVIMTCGELSSMYGYDHLAETYPDCVGNSLISTKDLQIIHVDFNGPQEEIGASLRLSFGMALWLAFFLHASGIEIYLALTPREAQRLRMVSYEKQLEAGMSKPGSSGFVVERFGDADGWKPTETPRCEGCSRTGLPNHGESELERRSILKGRHDSTLQ